MVTTDSLKTIVGGVLDPELPPLTIADLGILRSVDHVDGTVIVTVTPTYSGCPAVEVIENDIRNDLALNGYDDVRIVRAFTPAWTTDWITDRGRQKLTDAGIAPPRPISAHAAAPGTPVSLRRRDSPVACPRCTSLNTRLISRFGSTACKSLHSCDDCREPFDHFKEI